MIPFSQRHYTESKLPKPQQEGSCDKTNRDEVLCRHISMWRFPPLSH